MSPRLPLGILLSVVGAPGIFTAYLYASRHWGHADWLFLFVSVFVGAIGVHILPMSQSSRLGLMAVYVPMMSIGLIGWTFWFRGGL